jgi:hypothetical protein
MKRSARWRFLPFVFTVSVIRRETSTASSVSIRRLGFESKHQQGSALPAFSCSGTDLLLSGPESSGTRPLADGEQQEPGDGIGSSWP